MEKYEDDIHNCTCEVLAKMVREIARRHVDQDKATLLEAARRIENIGNIRIPFNHEQFNCP